MRRIIYFTGTRAEYGIMRSTLQRIEADSRLDLHIIASGMHVMDSHGHSIDLIKKDGFSLTELNVPFEDNTGAGVCRFMGKLISHLTVALEELKPDILLLLGDRVEILAAATTATYLSIPIAHIHGGDLSGTKDEQARHAITKLAHLHFPATEKSAQRIRLMGEEAWRILLTGSPSVAGIKEKATLTKKEIFKRYKFIEDKPLLILLQHPNVEKHAQAEIKETLAALRDMDIQLLIIYPNSDPGSNAIIEEIEKLREKEHIHIEKNLAYGEYLSALKGADLLIGNSSSGLIEAPSFSLPVINIGNREKQRERGENVIDVSPSSGEIKTAVKKALTAKYREAIKEMKNPYEQHDTAEKITQQLAKIKLGEKLLGKKLVFENE